MSGGKAKELGEKRVTVKYRKAEIFNSNGFTVKLRKTFAGRYALLQMRRADSSKGDDETTQI